MHWIQRHILEQLMTHDVCRFSELRADDVESNLFQYHLKHLIGKKLVEKCDGGYRLAPAGLYYADRFSQTHKGERPQSKIVTIAVIKDQNGRILMHQKPRQPWLGEYHLPAGIIHIGETAEQLVVKKAFEKTGACLSVVRFRGVAHVQIFKEDSLVSDYFGFIFLGQYDGDVEHGYWYDPDDENDVVELAPSVRELLGFERVGDNGFHPLVVEL